MRIALTLALALFPQVIAGCVPTEAPWDRYTAAVIYKRNHPRSVAAKDAIQRRFCEAFSVQPCAPVNGSSTELHLSRDFDISIPQGRFTDVVLWLQQYRYGSVNGANYSVDLMVYPDTGCADTDHQYALYVGHKSPLNVNILAERLHAEPVEAASSFVSSVDDSMFVSCSSDATCYSPYANNTGCTDNSNVQSMHFHFYFTSTDTAAVNASNKLIALTSQRFNLDLTVCPDNNGHEQPHNRTCWLTGPGGSGPIQPVGLAEDTPRGSFAIPDFSLYVIRDDFMQVLSYILQIKSKSGNGFGEVDFLVHPNCGCNYADHVFWGLHATTYIPANRQGVAEEAGWIQTWAPAVDPWSKIAPGNWPVEGCGLVGSQNRFERWAMHLFYDASNPQSDQARRILVDSLSGHQVDVGLPNPKAFSDQSSVAPTSEQVVLFNSSNLESVLPTVLQHRTEDVDVQLVPLSDGGRHWELNEFALEQGYEPVVKKRHEVVDSLSIPESRTSCDWPPRAYLLYMTASNDNGYQMNSAGLDSYKNGMLQAFSAKYPDVADCSSSRSIEPDHGGSMCFVGVNLTPFLNTSEPLMQSYAAVYVPSSDMTSMLSWAMDNRVAGKFGYNVDLRVVPLTGCPLEDFTRAALKAGPDWRLNDWALTNWMIDRGLE